MPHLAAAGDETAHDRSANAIGATGHNAGLA
jgi:hypothetical protein